MNFEELLKDDVLIKIANELKKYRIRDKDKKPIGKPYLGSNIIPKGKIGKIHLLINKIMEDYEICFDESFFSSQEITSLVYLLQEVPVEKIEEALLNLAYWS